MRGRTRLLLAAGATAVAAVVATELPALLRDVELFRVRDVGLEGGRFLDEDEATEVAAIPAGASVWDDPAPWEARLRGHPLVRDVRIRRELPGTLVMEVDERVPVAFAPTPVLRPVDARGEPLPLDPAAHALDLPVLRPPPGGDDPVPGAVRLRELAGEVARLGEIAPVLAARISEVGIDEEGRGLTVRLGKPGVTVRFRRPVTRRRAREALLVLADAVTRRGGLVPESVDLRFADQVVVRYPRERGRHADD